MSFHEFKQMKVQASYEVRRTGLNRLSIIIDRLERPVKNPRLVFYGDEAALVLEDNTCIILPEFPQEYIPELLQGRTVLIGEKEMSREGTEEKTLFPMAWTPVKRFFEAEISINRVSTPAGKTGGRIMPVVAGSAG